MLTTKFLIQISFVLAEYLVSLVIIYLVTVRTVEEMKTTVLVSEVTHSNHNKYEIKHRS